MIHLPQTGLEVLGPELQLSNLQTITPPDKTFEYRSFGHILSLLKQKLKFQVNNIRNGGLQPPQCSPMEPIFFLAANWSIYASIWAYEPGRLLLKGQKTGKPAALHRFWVLNILFFGDLLVCFNCSEVRRRIWNWWRALVDTFVGNKLCCAGYYGKLYILICTDFWKIWRFFEFW